MSPRIVFCRLVSHCRVVAHCIAAPRVSLHRHHLSLACVGVISPHLDITPLARASCYCTIHLLYRASHNLVTHLRISRSLVARYRAATIVISPCPTSLIAPRLKVGDLPIESFWIGMLVLVLQICFIKIIHFLYFYFI